jgi:hypothetical protein
VTADAVLAAVTDRLADRAARARSPRVTVGPRTLLVELRDPVAGRLAGVAHRPEGDPAGVPLDGSSVADLAGLAVDPPGNAERLGRAVGVATLNALSAPAVDWRPGDPMATLDPDVETVATVGLFGPAFRRFAGHEVRVVERDPTAEPPDPKGVDVSVHPPAATRRAFAGADVCFVTGSTLVYGGLGGYLRALAAASVPQVVLVGATASVVPEPLFDAGVDVVAGARVRDVAGVRAGVDAGGCGTDLHERGLEKVCAVPDSATAAGETRGCGANSDGTTGATGAERTEGTERRADGTPKDANRGRLPNDQ